MAGPFSIFESQLQCCLLQEALPDLPLRPLSAPYPCSFPSPVLIIAELMSISSTVKAGTSLVLPAAVRRIPSRHRLGAQ